MNFPKTKKKYIRGIGMVEIRPYLTTNEIDAILNTVQESTTDYAMRKMILYTTVMSTCTNLQDFQSEEVDLEIAEKYYTNGLFDRITPFIKGFDILVDGYKQLAIRDVYSRFESVLEGFTSQFKDINMEDTMQKFEAELNKLKEVNQEKEAILNGK